MYVCVCVLMTVCVCKMCLRLKYKAGEMYFDSSQSLSEVLLPFKHKAPNQTSGSRLHCRLQTYLREHSYLAREREVEKDSWNERKREMSLLAKLKAEVPCPQQLDSFWRKQIPHCLFETYKTSWMYVLSGLFVPAFLITQIRLNKIPLKRACTREIS